MDVKNSDMHWKTKNDLYLSTWMMRTQQPAAAARRVMTVQTRKAWSTKYPAPWRDPSLNMPQNMKVF